MWDGLWHKHDLPPSSVSLLYRHIQRPEALTSEGKVRFHFFNSFFFKKLSEVVSTQVISNALLHFGDWFSVPSLFKVTALTLVGNLEHFVSMGLPLLSSRFKTDMT